MPPNEIMDLGSDHQRLLNVIKSIIPVPDLHEIKGQRNMKCHKENNKKNPGYRKLYRKNSIFNKYIGRKRRKDEKETNSLKKT